MLDAESGHLFWFGPRGRGGPWAWARKAWEGRDRHRTLHLGEIREVSAVGGAGIRVAAERRTLDVLVDDGDTCTVLLQALRALVAQERRGIRVQGPPT